MSVALLDDILADNLHGIGEEDLSEEEIGRVKGMIVSGKGGPPAPAGKRWLYEVPASQPLPAAQTLPAVNCGPCTGGSIKLYVVVVPHAMHACAGTAAPCHEQVGRLACLPVVPSQERPLGVWHPDEALDVRQAGRPWLGRCRLWRTTATAWTWTSTTTSCATACTATSPSPCASTASSPLSRREGAPLPLHPASSRLPLASPAAAQRSLATVATWPAYGQCTCTLTCRERLQRVTGMAQTPAHQVCQGSEGSGLLDRGKTGGEQVCPCRCWTTSCATSTASMGPSTRCLPRARACSAACTCTSARLCSADTG